jgi:hypothetical protein
MREVKKGGPITSLVSESAGSLPFIPRWNFLFSAGVTRVSVGGINGPLLEVQNSLSMRIAEQKSITAICDAGP